MKNKFYPRKLTTAHQCLLHAMLVNQCRLIDELSQQERDHITTYYKMEGKHASHKVYNDCGDMHFRGYDYRYPNEQAKLTEEAERKAYYAQFITPLKQEIIRRREDAEKIRNALCVALYGYGDKEWRLRQALADKQSEVKYACKRIKELKKEINALQKEE